MKKELIVRLHKSFEEAAHHQDGVEFWYARELQLLLGYAEWRNFATVVDKAKIACAKAGQTLEDHFVGVNKMVGIGSGTSREIDDLALTRYACYLIAQNGNPRKDEIAFAMNYFAVQTRKQELIEQRIEELERLHAREKLTLSQTALSGVMYERGIDNQGFARVLSKGDAALFGGRTTQDMKSRLGIPAGHPLADFLPTLTIKAKDFANEVTNTQIKDQDLSGETDIFREHVRSNQDVRKILTDRNIRPEALPPAEDLKKVERRLKSEEKKLPKQAPSAQACQEKDLVHQAVLASATQRSVRQAGTSKAMPSTAVDAFIRASPLRRSALRGRRAPHGSQEFRVELAAHFPGAREDAAFGIEQHQCAGVVELAVGQRAVTDAKHTGDRSHVAGGGTGQRPPGEIELALVRHRQQRGGCVALRVHADQQDAQPFARGRRQRMLDGLAAVDDQRADVRAGGVEHRHDLRFTASAAPEDLFAVLVGQLHR